MTVAVVVALCTFIHRKPALLGVEPGSSQQMYWMAGVIAAGVVFLIIMGVYHLLNRHAAVQNFELRRQLAAGDDYRAVTTKKADSVIRQWWNSPPSCATATAHSGGVKSACCW
ncbi:hypothetical protein [Escherichia coli IS35]|nr:hypothetical protein [Escherichia coli IS35]